MMVDVVVVLSGDTDGYDGGRSGERGEKKMSFSAPGLSRLWTGVGTDSRPVNLHVVRMRDEAGAITKDPSDKGTNCCCWNLPLFTVNEVEKLYVNSDSEQQSD